MLCCCSASLYFILFESMGNGLLGTDEGRVRADARLSPSSASAPMPSSPLLLRQAQRESLNMRGAYLEVLGDFYGLRGCHRRGDLRDRRDRLDLKADAVASVVIALFISAAHVRAAAGGEPRAPRGDAEGDRHGPRPAAHPRCTRGHRCCHDLHAGTITSGMNVVSAHVVVADVGGPGGSTLDALCECRSDQILP